MRSWFRKPDPVRGDDPSRIDDEVRDRPGAFRLEALEPRVLLSADPISGEFARVIQDAADDDDDVAAIVQDISDVAELRTDAQSTATDPEVDVAWPDGWDDADESTVDDGNSAAMPDDSADDHAPITERWQDNLGGVMQAAGDDDSSSVSSATESDEPASADADDDTEPRAPPLIQSVTANDEIIYSGVLPGAVALVDAISPEFTDAEDFLRVDTSTGATRPATPTALTAADLEAAVALTLDLWGDYFALIGDDATAQELRATLDGLRTTFGAISDYATLIADFSAVDADLLGAAVDPPTGTPFLVDDDAAGYGWSTDWTEAPDDIDLLTVVLHEIGHLLGFAHGDTTNAAVMQETLAPGYRFLPGNGPMRPLLFVPGFAGTFAAPDGGTAADPTWSDARLEQWFLTRGIHPDSLALESLGQTYNNIVQSFAGSGYTEDADLFTVLWDWRVPVGVAETEYDSGTETIDGTISQPAADLFSEIADGGFDTAQHYLAYFLDSATVQWAANHRGVVPDGVDMVTHSTGGLVARAYLQSTAYSDMYNGRELPKVNNLVQVGVPNEGVSGVYNFLQNNFSRDATTRAAGLTLNVAYEAILSDETKFVSNPDGTAISKGVLDALGLSESDTQKWFIDHYVPTLQDLLTIEPNSFDDDTGLGAFDETRSGFESELLLDLNYASVGNAWIDQLMGVGVATIVYTNQIATQDQVVKKSGRDLDINTLEQEILPLTDYIGGFPQAGTTWYQDIDSDPAGSGGDGTVSTASASGAFQGDSRIADGRLVLLEITAPDVAHADLVNDATTQEQVLAAAGVATGTVSTSQRLSKFDSGLRLIEFGIFDFVDFGAEFLTEIPGLTLVSGNALVDALADFLGVSLQGIAELLDSVPEQTISTPAGDLVLSVDSGGLQVTSELELEIDEYFQAVGDITLRANFLPEPIDIATRLPGNLTATAPGLLTLLDGLLDDSSLITEGLVAAADLSSISNVPYNVIELYGNNLTVFTGVNGPYFEADLDEDGKVDENEVLTLFDLDGNGVLTVGDLRALSGGDAFGSLFTAAGNDSDVIDESDLIDALDTGTPSGNGLLEMAEITASTLLAASTRVPGDFDADEDGIIDGREIDPEATGVAATNVNFGGTFMRPSFLVKKLLPADFRFPSLWSLKATADEAGLVGFGDGVTARGSDILINVNSGDTWKFGSGPNLVELGPPVANFQSTYESVPDEGDGSRTVGPVVLDFDGQLRIGGEIGYAELALGNFLYVNGKLSFERGPGASITLGTGFPNQVSDAVFDFLQPVVDTFGTLTGLQFSNNFGTLSGVAAGTFQFGGADLNAFLGVGGPYWTDIDGNITQSWAFAAGTGSSPDEIEKRTVSAVNGSTEATASIDVLINGVADTLTVGQPLNPGDIVTLSAGTISLGDAANDTASRYGDLDGDTFVEVGETEELNADASGLVIDDFDFGMATFSSALGKIPGIKELGVPLKWNALRASADRAQLVGLTIPGLDFEPIAADLRDIEVIINDGDSWEFSLSRLFDVDGDGDVDADESAERNEETKLELGPSVVDFASTYSTNERQYLFDVLSGGDGIASVTDLDAALGQGHGVTEDLTTADELVLLLDIGGAPPSGAEPDEILGLDEVLDQLQATYRAALAPQILFDILSGGDGVLLSVADLDDALLDSGHGVTEDLTDPTNLVPLLDNGGADGVADDGLLGVEEVLAQLTDEFKNAMATVQSPANGDRIRAARNETRIRDADADKDNKFDPIGFEVGTGGAPVYLDFDGNQRKGATIGHADLAILEVLYISGSLKYEEGPQRLMTLGTGFPNQALNAISALLNKDIGGISAADVLKTTLNIEFSDDLQSLSGIDVSGWELGGADLQAFIGAGGRYWTDLDGDRQTSWAFETGAGTDVSDEAARTISDIAVNGMTATSIDLLVDGVQQTFNIDEALPGDKVITLSPGQVLTLGTVAEDNLSRYGDINGDDKVDANESGELNEQSTGLVIEDLDFGVTQLDSTLLSLPGLEDLGLPSSWTAMRGTASRAQFVGAEDIVATDLQDIEIAINTGDKWKLGPLTFGPPVIDFAQTFPDDERRLLFDILAGEDGIISADELNRALDGGGYTGGDLLNTDRLMAILDTAGGPTPAGGPDGVLGVGEVLSQLDGNFRQAVSAAALFEILAGDDNSISIEELNAALGAGHGLSTPDSPDQLLSLLDTGGASGTAGDNLLGVQEVLDQLTPDFEATVAPGVALTNAERIRAAENEQRILAADLDTDNKFDPVGYEIGTGGTPIYLDFDGRERIGGSVGYAEQSISDFVHITGSFAFEIGGAQVVQLADGLFDGVTDTVDGLLAEFGLPPDTPVPFLGSVKDVRFLTVGAADVHAFIGLKGPYWSDIDRDGMQSWAFETDVGSGATDVERRKVTEINGATTGTLDVLVNGALTTLSVGEDLPAGAVIKLTTGTISLGVAANDTASQYGDLDGDGEVQANETAELSEDAAGLVVDDFDFGMAIMTPTVPFDFGKYFALRASANSVSLVGIEDVTFDAREILVEVNQSTPSVFGVSLFPVVDFATTFASERDDLYEILAGDDGEISAADLAGALGMGHGISDVPTTVEQLTQLLDIGGAPPSGIGADEILGVGEVLGQLQASFREAISAELLFDILDGEDGTLTQEELQTALAVGMSYTGGDIASADALVALLDTGAGGGTADDLLLGVDEVLAQLAENFKVTESTIDGVTVTNAQHIADGSNESRLLAADGDNDGKFDPTGYEVNTGGAPVYLSMNSSLVRAEGAAEFNIVDNVIVTGSVALTLGPTLDVKLSDGDDMSPPTTKRVTSLTIGATDVAAFIGDEGPYWKDLDGDGEVSWGFVASTGDSQAEISARKVSVVTGGAGGELEVLVNGTPVLVSAGYVFEAGDIVQLTTGTLTLEGGLQYGDIDGNGPDDIDINETAELNPDAVGFNITDLDIGVVVMASVSDPGVYLAAKASVREFGVVGIDQLTAEGAFDVELNIGFGADGFSPNLDVVDFNATFNETLTGEDWDNDGELTTTGFEISTPNPNQLDPPPAVVIDFDSFFINLQLGGIVTVYTDAAQTNPIVRLNGLFIFQLDLSSIKAFVAAGLEFGPDIGAQADDKFFDLNALGGLVISAEGVAADIDISLDVGAALGDFTFDASAKARLIFNTSPNGQPQTITIPQRFVGFLDGTVPLAGSPLGDGLAAQGGADVTALAGLSAGFDKGRFKPNADDPDSLDFIISGTAPTLAELFPDETLPDRGLAPVAGPYFAIAISGGITIADLWGLTGRFGIVASAAGLQLSAEAILALPPIGSLEAQGDITIDAAGLTARLDVSGQLGDESLGLTVVGAGTFDLDTRAASSRLQVALTGTLRVGTYDGSSFNELARGSATAFVAVDSNAFQMGLLGNLRVDGALDFSVRAFVAFYEDGVVIDAGVALNVGDLSDFMSGSLTGVLQINTRPVTVTTHTVATIDNAGNLSGFADVQFLDADNNVKAGGLAAGSFLLDVKGNLSILSVLDVAGRVVIDVDQTGWSLAGTLGLSAGIFGLDAGIKVTLALNSEGEFQSNLDGFLKIGPDDFNLRGNVVLNVQYADDNGMARDGDKDYDLDAFGNISVGATVFGINLGDLSLKFEYENSKIVVKIPKIIPVPFINSKRISLGWFGSVTVYYPDIKFKDYTFTIGTIDLVEVEEPELGTVNAGVLTLHVGPALAGNRAPLSQSEDEIVFIDQRNGRIFVTMFGFEDSFVATGINTIKIDDMGPGDDYLETTQSVTANVEVHFGGDDDILVHNGSGTVQAWGDGGNDRLTGGPNADMLDGGTGEDVLRGRGGADSVKGGTGDFEDSINWAYGDGPDTLVDGGAGNDRLTIEGIEGSPLDLRISAAGTGFTAQIVGAGTLNVAAIESATILGTSGSDKFTINQLSNSLLSQVSLELGAGTASDSVIVNGSDAAESIDISSETSILVTSERVGDTADTVLIETPVDVAVVSIDAVTIDISGVGGSFGSDTLEVNALGGTDTINIRDVRAGLTTTVNTGDETSQGDTIRIGSTIANPPSTGEPNGLDGIASKLIIDGGDPTSGSDYLYIDDSADGTGDIDGVLTSDSLTGLGMAGGGIRYSGIEHLFLTLGTGSDALSIVDTHAGETIVNANGGNDTVRVRSIQGSTTINGNGGRDTINVGSNATTADGAAGSNTGGTLNLIRAPLTVNGNDHVSTGDTLNLDDQGNAAGSVATTLTSSTLNSEAFGTGGSVAYATLEHLRISLGGGSDTVNIESTHNAATGFRETTTVNTGAGTDTVHVISVTDTLIVNGEDDVDTINVKGTNPGSTSTFNGGDDGDIFNVLDIDGTVYVNGDGGNDTINVSDKAPAMPTAGDDATDTSGTVDEIDGLLVVDGGTGTADVLNVDDSNSTDLGKTAMLTATSLRGLAMPSGIDYSNLDTLNLWLDAGGNTVNIDGTHEAATNVYARNGSDVVNVRGTGFSSTTSLYGQSGIDTFNVSDQSPTLPADYPATQQPPAADRIGGIDDVNGVVLLDGGVNVDTVNIDDSGNTADKAATLTDNVLLGLGLEGRIDYLDAEDFNLWLGTGTDTLYVDSTHAGTTQLYGGDGNAALNERDDTIAIRSIGGTTTIHGQGGNDGILVNVGFGNGGDGFDGSDVPGLVGIDAANDAQFFRTHTNGLDINGLTTAGTGDVVLNLHGDGDSDRYTVNLSGEGEAVVNVVDTGAPNNGSDRLTINGAEAAAANGPDDTFLLRFDFVALLNAATAGGGFDQVERVNYDENINERLVVNGLEGNDTFVADDNSSITTLDGGEGADRFQIGQVFATLRTAEAANIAGGDEFEDGSVSRIIVGIIRDPVSGDVIFDPSVDLLTPEKIAEIGSHIDEVTGFLAGIAYVSDGVSQPTTVYGGGGDDEFSVYQNKGTLRLEGEAGDDDFIVRAFVLLPDADGNVQEQAETEVVGGDNNDTIQYAINAPVNIDGGTGFDTVVVLGTPFPDAFVVTSEGIFGAGLNVTFDNVESAELDTLEGDDTIYVLGTSADIVTTIIGGLGDDTVEIMGDVVSAVVSNDLLGRAGVITHGFVSTSGAFDNVGVNGVDASVVAADAGSLVDIGAAGTRSALAEQGEAVLEYLVQLTNPAAGTPGPTAAVHITVSAGLVSSRDRALTGDADSVLVSTDGTNWSKSVVLTFTDTNIGQTIYVKAVDDGAAEGNRLALISHSVNSADARYDDIPLADVLVDVIDNDKAGIDIRQFEEIRSGRVPDGVTEILEGAGGFSDVYDIALTRAPEAGETVTVTLSTSDQLSYRNAAGQVITEVSFTAANWNVAQQVRVVAESDGITKGTSVIRIIHAITSDVADSDFDKISEDEYPALDVTVYDTDAAGAIIRESDGRTIVMANAIDEFVDGDDDSYRVRLTQSPSGGEVVVLQLFTDRQTELVADGRLTFVGEHEATGTFEYQLTFDINNWDDWYEVRVVANEDFVPGNGQPLKTFTPQDQNLDQIQGPLIIAGGVLEGRDRSLAPALLLPGETDGAVSQDQDPNSDPSGEIDRVNIFHADNIGDETGAMVSRSNPFDADDANPWTALTGFEMDRLGSTLVVGPDEYGRGITFDGFEIVEVLLGKGDESLNISATAHDAITVVHGGGGDDTITITGRGNGPLVVYGDTSQNRERYNNDTAFPSPSGTFFDNDGVDTIDASGMAGQSDGFAGVVIYGGFGNDEIDGSPFDDHIAGGTGDDVIRAHGGNDHVYGDSHFDINFTLFARDRLLPFPNDATEVDDMFIILDETPGDDEAAGADRIKGGDGDDVIFGDHGAIAQEIGTRRLTTTGLVDSISSTNRLVGGADVIFGQGGEDLLIGGFDDDLIDGGADSDLIFGDAVALQGRDTVTLQGLEPDITSKRFQALLGRLLYSRGDVPAFLQGLPDADGNGLPDFSGNAAGQVLIDGVAREYRNPGGSAPAWAEFEIIDLYHDVDTQAEGATDGGFGNDYIAGNAGHDMIFGQLGDDVIQGDGSIDSALDVDNPVVVHAGRIVVDNQTITVSPSLDPLPAWTLDITPSFDSVSDGDDYIEGNGGSDVIFGNLGQDDIVGGSSDMFSLTTPEQRPDVDDFLFGGSGTEIAHDELVNNEANDLDTIIPAPDVHARDADVIAGDNANIYRIVGAGAITLPGEAEPAAESGIPDTGGFLSFAYDKARHQDPLVAEPPVAELIRVRAVELLDYTAGGPDFADAILDDGSIDPSYPDIGAGDEIHGESGDDFIYGMVGPDVLFGDSESDDLVGGWGADWISGGQGMDGVLGDDGRIYTSRYAVFDGNGNKTAADPALVDDYAEILNGVLRVDQLDKPIRTPGDILTAIINPSEMIHEMKVGAIFKSVDITPFNLDPAALQDMMQDRDFAPEFANDIIFGGLGNDFLHGAAGDDAISGAEALPEYFEAPVNPGDLLNFDPSKIEFADYEEEFPRRFIPDFVLNFDPAGDIPNDSETQNDSFDEDVLFGDLGNDWLVGGPDNDRLFGGFGADLLDADDDKSTDANGDGIPGDNYGPDPIDIDIQDLVYGGGGRDVLIANTGGDRLVDWVGEFDSYIVPFAPFGEFTVTRAPTPQNFDFLYELSESLGADQSRAVETGTDPARNGEPDGELGLVRSKDGGLWQEQSGAPIDPQPGNIPGGPRITLRGVDFNGGMTEAFAVDQGVFQVNQGRLEVSSTNLGETASAVFHVGEYLPHYFEVLATISTGKPTAGLKANSYIIFDYVSPTDFKYAGINISTDKLEIGYVDESGWHELVQEPARLKHSTDYDVLLAINGLTVTLVVDNKDVLSHTFDARVDDDGFAYGLNYGLVGLGGIGSVARVDNMIVQKLSPEITFEATESFDLGAAGFLPLTGDWTVAGGTYTGINTLPGNTALSLFDLNVDPNSYLELQVTVVPGSLGGIVFDSYANGTYKFVGVLADTNEVVIGHIGKSGNVVYDAVGDITFNTPGKGEYELRVSLSGSTVSVAVLGGTPQNPTWNEVVGHVFNAVTVDGQAGLISIDGASEFDDFAIRTDDPEFISDGEELVAPSLSLEDNVPSIDSSVLQPLLDEAIRRMTASLSLDAGQQSIIAGVEVTVADLPGLVLARSNGKQIEIDADAAGHGWFLDPTPGDDAEFDAGGVALAGSDAEGDIDLLTVLVHELGHVLGFEHGSLTIMEDSLATGERWQIRGESTASSNAIQGAADTLLPVSGKIAIGQAAHFISLTMIDGVFFDSGVMVPSLVNSGFTYDLRNVPWFHVLGHGSSPFWRLRI